MIQKCPQCGTKMIPRDGRCPSCQWALDGVGGFPPPKPKPAPGPRKARDPVDTLALCTRITGWIHVFITLILAAITVLGVAALISESRGVQGPRIMYMTVGVIMYGVMALAATAYTITLFWLGRSLRLRKSYVPCFVIVCLSLPLFPFGMALGIAGLVILLMEESKEQFQVEEEMAGKRSSFEP